MFFFARSGSGIGEEWHCASASVGTARVLSAADSSGSEQIVICDCVVRSDGAPVETILVVVPVPDASVRFLREECSEAESNKMLNILRATEGCFPGTLRQSAVDEALIDAEEKADLSGEEVDDDKLLKDTLHMLKMKQDAERCAVPVCKTIADSLQDLKSKFDLIVAEL